MNGLIHSLEIKECMKNKINLRPKANMNVTKVKISGKKQYRQIGWSDQIGRFLKFLGDKFSYKK